MTSTIISLAIVGVILISAAYFLFKQRSEKSNTGSTTIGNSDTNTEDINDTSGRGGISNDSNN
jgi:hypothetical protein